MLNYVPKKFEIETDIKEERKYHFNNEKINYNGIIVYLMEREMRIKDNFALNYARKMSKIYGMPLKLLYDYKDYEIIQKNHFINYHIFNIENIEVVKNKNMLEYLNSINTGLLIIDFNPISQKTYLKEAKFKIIEIDGHNIVPARFVSKKQEFSAQTLRRRIYKNLDFLTEYPKTDAEISLAEIVLKKFIKNDLEYYAKNRNNPNLGVNSRLSKFINWGFISSQRVALEIIKSKVSDENKEAFLEELIVRKELADNFCLYCTNFKNFDCIQNWAKKSLNLHKKDFRQYLYSKKELEKAQTHDKLWNTAQKQLIKEGCIHSYLRMYWAKQILLWSKTPQNALKNAIYLNDKYAYDAPSSSGYVGILWAIGGLHDRPFAERPIFGKIRSMTFNGSKSKFDVEKYVNRYC